MPLLLVDLLLDDSLRMSLIWDEYQDREKTPKDVLPKCFTFFLMKVSMEIMGTKKSIKMHEFYATIKRSFKNQHKKTQRLLDNLVAEKTEADKSVSKDKILALRNKIDRMLKEAEEDD